MKNTNDGLNVGQINEALSQVRGLNIPGTVMAAVGGSRPAMKVESLQVEGTNEALSRITGGYIAEKLSHAPKPKAKVVQESKDRRNVFQKIRDSHIVKLSEASNYEEFKTALSDMVDDVKTYQKKHNKA